MRVLESCVCVCVCVCAHSCLLALFPIMYGRRTALSHKLLSYSQLPMRAHHGQAGDVAVLDTVCGLLLHLGQDVSDNLGVVIGRLLRAGDIDRDEAKLGP